MGKVIYAIYKDDVFIDLGTRDELAKRLNVTPRYISRLAMPSTFKRMENRQCKRQGKLIAIRIGKEDDKL